MSWEDAWKQGRTGWDQGCAAGALIALLERNQSELPNTGHALVSGCGAGYDAMALAKHGFVTTGADIAPSAKIRFNEVRSDHNLSPEQVHLEVLDFFSDTPRDAPFDVIWDYTFLCAIEPDQRANWAQRMWELCAPEGRLVTLIFPVVPDDNSASTTTDPGPPYRLHPDVVADLLEGHFILQSLEPAPNSSPSRAGKEFLAIWKKVS
jgi:hypothetical protein